jgi:hypothetical protein
MRTSTCLSLCFLVIAACDDDDSDPAVDAGPDAPEFDGDVADADVDATPPSAFGLWSIESVERDGITVEAGAQTKLGRGATRRVNGLLHLDQALGEGAIGEVHLVGDILDEELTVAGAAEFSVQNQTELEFAGTWTLDWDEKADTLDLTQTGKEATHVIHFVRYQHAAKEDISVGGLAVVAGKDTSYVSPRVTLVSVTRDSGGAVRYIVVDPAAAEGNDTALPEGFGGELLSASFTVGRPEGALGVDRIAYGNGFASVLLIVGYEDKDGNGKLDAARLGESDCSSEALDCVRAVSPFAVAYRAGASAELDASPFNLLLAGWHLSYLGADFRNGGLAVPVPLDPTRAPVPAWLTFQDPENVQLPNFGF